MPNNAHKVADVKNNLGLGKNDTNMGVGFLY
jgi:hypothetical protein